MFDRIGSPRTSSRSTRPDCGTSTSISTSSTTAPVLVIGTGSRPTILDPVERRTGPPASACARPTRTRPRPRSTSTGVGAHEGQLADVVRRVGSTWSGTTAATSPICVNLNQPANGNGARPIPTSRTSSGATRTGRRATTAWTSASSVASRRAGGFSVAYTLTESTDQSAGAPLDRRLAGLPQDTSDLEAWEGPMRLRHRAPFRRQLRGPVCRSRGDRATGLDECAARRLDGRRHLRLPHRPALHGHPGQQQRGPGAHRATEPRGERRRARRRSTSGSSPPTSRR